jgi:FkbM family methyltransferase
MSALRRQYSGTFELLRRAVRNSIGFRSPVYQLGSSLLTSAEIIRREGYGTWKRLRALSNRKDASPELILLRGLKHPIYVRPGTEDLDTVINNVIREEYGQGQSFFTGDPQFMIDAGAFIGDTAAYFLSRFPTLKVVALEPNLENFSLARENLAPYGNRVELLHSALGGSAGNVRFRGQSTGGFVHHDGISVSMTTVPLLLKSRPETPLDILKLDIEGEELAVLSDAASDWLPKVGQIIVEIHGRKIEERVLPILSRNGFKVRRYRSIWLCTNTSWRSTS